MPRKTYHHGDLRRALVEGALALVEADGLEALTTRSLARRLGVSHAAPAHHFHDRDALVVAVGAEAFRRFADRLATTAKRQADAQGRVVAIGRAYVKYAIEHSAPFRLMFGAGRPGGAPPDALRALGVLGEALGGDGELVLTAWALVHGLAMLWLDGPAHVLYPSRAAFERQVEHVLMRATRDLVK